MKYLLDTDICSLAVMGHPHVFARLDSIDRDAWAISSLVVSELQFGLVKGQLTERSRVALEKFLRAAPVVGFDLAAAREAALVRFELEKKGRPAGVIDQLLAGHAKSLGAVMVTGNTRQFDQVSSLLIENWTTEPIGP